MGTENLEELKPLQMETDHVGAEVLPVLWTGMGLEIQALQWRTIRN